MHRINQVRILNLLRQHGTLSRIDLTRKTGLDGKTITNLARELIADKFIHHEGYEPSSGGRKPELLSLSGDSNYALGVCLDCRRITALAVNLRGQVICRSTRSLDENLKRDEVLRKIKSVTLPVAEKAAGGKLIGACFVLPAHP